MDLEEMLENEYSHAEDMLDKISSKHAFLKEYLRTLKELRQMQPQIDNIKETTRPKAPLAEEETCISAVKYVLETLRKWVYEELPPSCDSATSLTIHSLIDRAVASAHSLISNNNKKDEDNVEDV